MKRFPLYLRRLSRRWEKKKLPIDSPPPVTTADFAAAEIRDDITPPRSSALDEYFDDVERDGEKEKRKREV